MAASPGRLLLTSNLHCKKNHWRRSNPEGKFKWRWCDEDSELDEGQRFAMDGRGGGDHVGGRGDIRSGVIRRGKKQSRKREKPRGQRLIKAQR